MTASYPPFRASDGHRPLHAFVTPFPVVCFVLALVTDIAFWQTGNLMWQNFSAWLLFAGLVFGGLALLVAIVEVVRRLAVGGDGPYWPGAVAGLAVLALALWNSFVHAGDGWTAVVPYGLALSAATVVLMIAAAVLLSSTARRRPEFAR